MKTKDKLIAAGIEPDDADLSDIWKVTHVDDGGFELKKLEVGSELSGLLGYVGTSQSTLAAALGWSNSRVSKVLSGSENLTLKTINEVCGAIGYTYHVTFCSLANKRRPSQPWDDSGVDQEVVNLHLSLQETYKEAKAILECARVVNRAAFRRDLTPFGRPERVFKSKLAANEVRNGPVTATA